MDHERTHVAAALGALALQQDGRDLLAALDACRAENARLRKALNYGLGLAENELSGTPAVVEG